MTEYLITDLTTGIKTWIAGASLDAALIAAETARRVRSGETAMQPGAKCWYDKDGSIIRCGIGRSACLGYRENVVREE